MEQGIILIEKMGKYLFYQNSSYILYLEIFNTKFSGPIKPWSNPDFCQAINLFNKVIKSECELIWSTCVPGVCGLLFSSMLIYI